MSERPQVVIPRPADRQIIDQFKPWWQQAEERWYGKFVPYNVRHQHDPEWRNRFWSIQAAHDRKGFWQVVAVLFYVSMYAFTFMGFGLLVVEIGPMAVVAGLGCWLVIRALIKAAEEF